MEGTKRHMDMGKELRVIEVDQITDNPAPIELFDEELIGLMEEENDHTQMSTD